MNKVYRVFVEKRSNFATLANETLKSLNEELKINNLKSLRVVYRYDIQGVGKEALEKGINIILSEPMVDDVYLEECPINNETIIAIEYLPGQYDQRADACIQCFEILTGEKNVKVKCAKLIIINQEVNAQDVLRIQDYLINPVDQRLASLEKPANLDDEKVMINKVPVIEGFIDYNENELRQFLKDNSMAMNYDDLFVTQEYFKCEEHRNPTETEIKVLDTYWSDHCRHTTFSTILSNVIVEDGEFKHLDILYMELIQLDQLH